MSPVDGRGARAPGSGSEPAGTGGGDMGTTVTGTRADAVDERSDRPYEWGWVLRVLALVAAFALVAWGRSRQVDIPFKDPHGKLFMKKLPSTAQMLLVFVVI